MLKLTYIAVLDDGDTYSDARGATLQGYTDATRDAFGTEQACAPEVCIELSAIPELLAVAESVIARWDNGDLAAAVRNLSNAIARARGQE